MPHDVSPIELVARAVLVALLALWTLGFLRHGMAGRSKVIDMYTFCT